MNLKIYTSQEPLFTEAGSILEAPFNIAYNTYGTLNAERNNVIWICHALTGNSDAADWWNGLVGKNKLFDPAGYFIVCANVIGSAYGSTGPLSVNPATGSSYFHSFPLLTIRDVVQTLERLRIYLGITGIHTLIGGSLGGQQALEWAIENPDLHEHLVLTATCARSSAWSIAINESQRIAIEADSTWATNSPEAGLSGLKAARAIALLSYRNYATYKFSQAENDDEIFDDFKASGYQRYQGIKLTKRFNTFSYWTLSKMMDSHNVGRGRDSVESALSRIRAQTLVIGIRSDILFPVAEQKFLARYIPDAEYAEIDSSYGHDGFLTECNKLTVCVKEFSRLRNVKVA
ncbi:MAG: homoserine O-acetyltransferase [Bacteroidota bacterium]